MTTHSDESRRQYWTTQMEEGAAFMDAIRAYPVVECGEKFVSLVDAAKGSGVEVLFLEKPHVEGLPRLYYLRERQIEGFLNAAREMNSRGWIMRVEDGFRTRRMQKMLTQSPAIFDAVLRTTVWELGGKTPSVELITKRCGSLIASCPKVGTHMSGSAIDISVLDRATGEEVNRGKAYLEMSELTPMASPFVEPGARAMRLEIMALMRRHGFVEYPYEFWHFNGGDAYAEYLLGSGKPGRYGAVDWDAATNQVTPIEDPLKPLNTAEEIAQMIAGALARRG